VPVPAPSVLIKVLLLSHGGFDIFFIVLLFIKSKAGKKYRYILKLIQFESQIKSWPVKFFLENIGVRSLFLYICSPFRKSEIIET